MRVRVVVAFGAYRVGDIIPEMPGTQAEHLKARGFVEYDEGQVTKPGRAAGMRSGRDYVTR